MTITRNVKGILGKKLGMTQGWDANNKMIPITVVEVGSNVITQIKNQDTDGYQAIQVAFGSIDPRKVNKPDAGHFAKAGVTPRRFLAEIRTADADTYAVGQEQEVNNRRLQQLQGEENQRQNWEKQLQWQREQERALLAEIERLDREKVSLDNQLNQIRTILHRKNDIITAHERLINLDQKEASLSSQLQAWQQAQYDKQQLEQKLQQKINEFTLPIQQTSARLEELERQEQETQKIIEQAGDIQAGLEKLNYHRQRLQELDRLALKYAPLNSRKADLNMQLEREKAKINARWEQLQRNRQQLETEIARIPLLREEALNLAKRIKELDKKQTYCERVEEKETLKQVDKKSLLDQQKRYEEQLLELTDKLEKLNIPDSVCPLCEQNLDSHHRHQVIRKTHQHQECKLLSPPMRLCSSWVSDCPDTSQNVPEGSIEASKGVIIEESVNPPQEPGKFKF